MRRGYHRARVDDIVAAAGVSHGAFYRYFENKEQLARILTARAMQTVGAAWPTMPDYADLDGASGGHGPAPVAPPVRRHPDRRGGHDAGVGRRRAGRTPALAAGSAPALDWGRRQLARLPGARVSSATSTWRRW